MAIEGLNNSPAAANSPKHWEELNKYEKKIIDAIKSVETIREMVAVLGDAQIDAPEVLNVGMVLHQELGDASSAVLDEKTIAIGTQILRNNIDTGSVWLEDIQGKLPQQCIDRLRELSILDEEVRPTNPNIKIPGRDL